MNEIERSLAIECRIAQVDYQVGQSYFEKKGHPIGESTYYKYLKEIDSDEELTRWMNEQSRIGFLANQRNIVEGIKNLMADTTRLLKDEMQKQDTVDIETKAGTMTIPNPAKSKQFMGALISNLTTINKRLEEVNLASPIVASIRAKIEQTVFESREDPSATPRVIGVV